MTLWAAVVGFFVISAGIYTVDNSFHPFDFAHFASATVVAVAAVVTRINAIPKLLRPSDKRKKQLHSVAESGLMPLLMNKKVSDDLLSVTLHIWEVPSWYRRVFPFSLRLWLKKLVRGQRLQRFARYSRRPTLHRAAAVALQKREPSGVAFCKGIGIVGICLERNDPDELLKLDVQDPAYGSALASSCDDWDQLGPEMTRGLVQSEAQILAKRHGQVVARVVRHPDRAEAIGCVTVSVRSNTKPALQIIISPAFVKELKRVAGASAEILASR